MEAAVIALLPLLTLHAASVVVAPGPDDGCPSARQVAAALERVTHAGGEGVASVLTLVLPPPGTPMEPSFSLVDEEGRLKLFRSLAKPGDARPRVCAALADTIAIIVQRYLEEIEVPSVAAPAPTPVQAPAPPAQPQVSPPVPPVEPPRPEPRDLGRTWDLGVMSSFRSSAQVPGLADVDGQLVLGRTFVAAGQPFELLISGGVAGWASCRWQGGHGTLWRFPASLSLVWRRKLGRAELQVGPVFLADVLNMRAASDEGQARASWGMASAGGVQGGVQIQAGRHGFFRLVGEAAAAAVRFDYVGPGPDEGTVLSTPAFFGNVRIALGMSFR